MEIFFLAEFCQIINYYLYCKYSLCEPTLSWNAYGVNVSLVIIITFLIVQYIDRPDLIGPRVVSLEKSLLLVSAYLANDFKFFIVALQFLNEV